jgi:outer membrane protein TolC
MEAQQVLDSSQFQPFPSAKKNAEKIQDSGSDAGDRMPLAALPSLVSGQSSPNENRADSGSSLESDVANHPEQKRLTVPSNPNPSLEQLMAEQFAKAYHDDQASNPESAAEAHKPIETGFRPFRKAVSHARPLNVAASALAAKPTELSLNAESLHTKSNVALPSPMSETPAATTASAGKEPFRDLGTDADRLAGISDPEQLDWWKTQVVNGIFAESSPQSLDLNTLVYQALNHSPRIQAISQSPLIRELQVIEADSVFDPAGFVRNNYNDRNDPVGNTLVTGGPPFLRDNIWSGDFGVKKKTRTGAKVELGQKLGFQNSNSRFFQPQDQGTATLALNVTQPLLRGRGKFINQSQVLIAQAQSGVAWSTFSGELQDELQQVVEAYWRLFYDRSRYLQKKRNVERGQQILDILQARKELDSLPSQIARARSAVELRRTELANALRDIRNSETEIRRRIADRDWMTAQRIELVPSEMIGGDPNEIPLEQIVHTALENRPEIKESLQRAKAVGIQYQISENDLLPELSLLVGGYVSALNPESGVLQSWGDQFGNRPGYNAGLNFEMPYGNRAARSRLSQQKLQLTKIKAEVDEAMQLVIAESQVAFRRVQSAIQTRQSALVSIEAAREDLAQQASRWEQFGLVEGDFAEGQNPVILLNQVLDAQERLVAAELILAQADLELKIAEISLQRTMGTLLICQNVNFSMSADRDEPYMQLGQPEPAVNAVIEQ